ncbi:hypothetical protein CS542_07735 [Pedobacter sp. IW39]|nr:hypothetical protein CS542_07735 [Pedobacter sp. IW39]
MVSNGENQTVGICRHSRIIYWLRNGFGGITPIIKRISTSSFVSPQVVGSYLLAAIYWLVDVKQNIKYAWIFTVVGMNAILFMSFSKLPGMNAQWCCWNFYRRYAAFAFNIPANFAGLISALAVFGLQNVHSATGFIKQNLL